MILSFLKIIAKELDAKYISYLVVGGSAKLLYGWTNKTKDVDILIRSTKENLIKFQSFVNVTFNIGLSIEDLIKNNVISIKSKPYSIDFHLNLDGISEEGAFSELNSIYFEDQKINFISEADLTLNINQTIKKWDT